MILLQLWYRKRPAIHFTIASKGQIYHGIDADFLREKLQYLQNRNHEVTKLELLMGNKILKTLTKNLGFKILAVVFAFILWLVVYNTTMQVAYTTNVTVENASVVADMNKCYEVLNGTNTDPLR